jgi:glycosyltransferase involved in cell wall biosynthesis
LIIKINRDYALKSKKAINLLDRANMESCDYSICTLVTKFDEYDQMLASFHANGFIEPACEFLYIDNSNNNQFDAYTGINALLRWAKGKYIIVCHQDIELLEDDIEELGTKLTELEALDPNWAIAGNSGGVYQGSLNDLAVRISDPHGENIAQGPFPSRVTGLDENFIVIKAQANLALSGNISGFHLYATDMSIIASVLGFRSYVIDFHLKHKSRGIVREGDDLYPGEIGYPEIRETMVKKYRLAFATQWVSSPTTEFFIFPQIFSRIRYNLARACELLWLSRHTYRMRLINLLRKKRNAPKKFE